MIEQTQNGKSAELGIGERGAVEPETALFLLYISRDTVLLKGYIKTVNVRYLLKESYLFKNLVEQLLFYSKLYFFHHRIYVTTYYCGLVLF